MNEDSKFYIPANLSDNRKFLGIQNRNLIETGVIEAVLFLILRSLPFITGVKAVIAAVVMIPAGVIAVMGIKNESLTEFIISTLLFNRNKKIMHFRSPDQTMSEDENETKEENTPKEKDLLNRFLDIISLRRNDASKEESDTFETETEDEEE